MKGPKEIVLGQDTVIAAIQMYLDQVIFKDTAGMKVTGFIKASENGGYNASTNYEVTLFDKVLETAKDEASNA